MSGLGATNGSLAGSDPTAATFDPTMANLTAAGLDSDLYAAIVCYLQNDSEPYDGELGVRISALFVILILSTSTTLFPVIATRVPKLKIPLYVYLFARYFGAGVIVATAFIHLLDPAYAEIGPQTCVGLTGNWAQYSWVPAIAMTSALTIFFIDFAAERYVEKKYGIAHGIAQLDDTHNARLASVDAAMLRYSVSQPPRSHQFMHSGEVDGTLPITEHSSPGEQKHELVDAGELSSLDLEKERLADLSFKQQIVAFLVLEFGVIFHSVIIGLTLATSTYDNFKILYAVIVFHQSFEGLGIGARLSAIQFPRKLGRWLPWVLCLVYGFTTPIAIAVGLGVNTTYDAGSYTANVVSGILDSVSAGILLYAGLVELLARDFLFNPERTRDDKQLAFMSVSVLLGAGLMALLGKWA